MISHKANSTAKNLSGVQKHNVIGSVKLFTNQFYW